MSQVIHIDGRYGEGGGQILRTSLALAAIIQRPVEIHHIRGGRRQPGLRPQHLFSVKAMALVTSARVKGAEQRSTDLCFEPYQIQAGNYSLDVGTAGSTSLVLQTLIPALLTGKDASRVTVTGGTHVPWSPCFHYLRDVFARALRQMGASLSLEIERWGWYPKGGGKVIAKISPISSFQKFDYTLRGEMEGVYVLSAVSNLPLSIAERQRDQVIRRLRSQGYKAPKIELLDGLSPGTGTVVFVCPHFEKGNAGFSSLGKRGKPAEEVANDACSEFSRFVSSQGAVDVHLADQLALYMALGRGRSTIVTERITEHLKTNVWVIEQFLPVKFEVDESIGRVSVEGVGLSP
jgi:RNA 3'-terminal phosphate cyclase (ATP)